MARPTGDRLLFLASVVGLAHAAFSFYWAFGGRWLLDTVGQGAVDLAEDSPLVAAAVLIAAGSVKAAGAVVPLLVEQGTLPGRRWWRLMEWAGSVLLIGYGGLLTAVSSAVLAGWIEVEGGYDRTGMLGHALLWDPLFFLWGVALAVGLWRTRKSGWSSSER